MKCFIVFCTVAVMAITAQPQVPAAQPPYVPAAQPAPAPAAQPPYVPAAQPAPAPAAQPPYVPAAQPAAAPPAYAPAQPAYAPAQPAYAPAQPAYYPAAQPGYQPAAPAQPANPLCSVRAVGDSINNIWSSVPGFGAIYRAGPATFFDTAWRAFGCPGPAPAQGQAQIPALVPGQGF